jgi:hypothetical protein
VLATENPVVAGVTVEHVLAVASDDPVGPVVAVDRVVALAAVCKVVARAGPDLVVPTVAVELVVAADVVVGTASGVAVDRVTATATADDIVAGRVEGRPDLIDVADERVLAAEAPELVVAAVGGVGVGRVAEVADNMVTCIGALDAVVAPLGTAGTPDGGSVSVEGAGYGLLPEADDRVIAAIDGRVSGLDVTAHDVAVVDEVAPDGDVIVAAVNVGL